MAVFFQTVFKNMCNEFKKVKPDIKLIYHGCVNASEVMDKLFKCEINAYQSLEVEVGIDVVELKKKYKNRLAYVENIDARDVFRGDKEMIKSEVMRKLNAAKSGGYIPLSDYRVPDSVGIQL